MGSTRRTGTAVTMAMGLVAPAGCREVPPARPAGLPHAVANTPAAPVPSGTPIPSDRTAGPPVPFESEGACPFECCTYRTWSVERATGVRAARDPGAPVAFALKAGEKVEALTGVIVVGRPGRARAPRDVPIQGLGTLSAGDEVSVLHPLGEGFWLVWRDGKTGSAQVGETPARSDGWNPELHQTEKPQFTWWVQVRDGQGRVGWTDRPDDFGNKDRCG